MLLPTIEQAAIEYISLTLLHYRNAGEVFSEFKKRRVRMTSLVRAELERQIFAPVRPGRVNLVLVSAVSMGLPETPRYDSVLKRAKKLGLERCQWQVGYQYRLFTAKSQPKDQHVVVVSHPFSRLTPKAFFAVANHKSRINLILHFFKGRSNHNPLFLFVDPT